MEEFRSDCETGYAAAEDDDGWRLLLLLGHCEVPSCILEFCICVCAYQRKMKIENRRKKKGEG